MHHTLNNRSTQTTCACMHTQTHTLPVKAVQTLHRKAHVSDQSQSTALQMYSQS